MAFLTLEVYTIASYIACGMSILACLWYIIRFFRMNIRSTTTKIILMVSIFDLITGLTWLVSSIFGTRNNCATMILLLNFTYWCALFWSTSLAIFSYKVLCGSDSFTQQNYFKKSFLTIVPTCLIVALLPRLSFFPLQYGKNGDFCAFTANPSLSPTLQTILVVLFQGLPVVPAIIVTWICYQKEYQFLKELQTQSSFLKPEKLFWYPVTQIIVYLPRLLFLSMQSGGAFNGDNILIFILFFLARLGGFVNTMVYILSVPTQKKKEPKNVSKVSLTQSTMDLRESLNLERGLESALL